MKVSDPHLKEHRLHEVTVDVNEVLTIRLFRDKALEKFFSCR